MSGRTLSARYSDCIGKTFGRLTVIRQYPERIKGEWYFECMCDCGNVVNVRRLVIVHNRQKSCGCLKHDTRSQFKHGYSHTPEYETWINMLSRCEKPNHRMYKYYGGRGIAVCEQWRGGISGFENFLRDMGKRPSPEHELDREKNDLGYSPENCRWATRKEQMRNTRQNRRIEFAGESLCVEEWAERTGIPSRILWGRIRLKWPAEKMLTTPTVPRCRKA